MILADSVANGTNWGQAMKDRPGVYVAGTTTEVMDIVEQVWLRMTATDSKLSHRRRGGPAFR